MRRRLALVVGAVLLSLTSIATSAAAQSHVRLGAFLGGALDVDDDWLLFGAEARFRGARSHFDIQPSFYYHPFDNGSALQLDGNILFNLDAPISQIVPYMGTGIAINRISFDGADDDTSFGVNFVMGLIGGTNPKWRPYAQFEYSSLFDAGDRATLTLGVLFNIRGFTRAARRAGTQIASIATADRTAITPNSVNGSSDESPYSRFRERRHAAKAPVTPNAVPIATSDIP
jgi:hypothetical protein